MDKITFRFLLLVGVMSFASACGAIDQESQLVDDSKAEVWEKSTSATKLTEEEPIQPKSSHPSQIQLNMPSTSELEVSSLQQHKRPTRLVVNYCVYHEKVYQIGESFPDVDGCNSCICSPDGIECTLMHCMAQPNNLQPTE